MSVLEEVDRVAAEDSDARVKAEKEARYVEPGTYEGTVLSWVKKEKNPEFPDGYGDAPVYNVGVTLYDCPELDKKKTIWLKFCPKRVLSEKGKDKAAFLAMDTMQIALGMKGEPLADIFEQAKVTRLKYKIEGFLPEGKTEKVNFCRGVSAV
jgi:hypothetical protein